MVSSLARYGLLFCAFLAAASSIALAETLATPAPPAKVGQASAASDFGTPPSGQIPILYNDRHVYTKPDVLKQGRVLAALVKGGTILIPLRSMFEQMGATVSYDAASRTATVSKPGSEIKVTIGKPVVLINGESRPLDVPPMIYQGDVLVPVRVISEGMAAYVQWVPDQHVVVVRYIPATPPPPPATAPPPAPPPTPTLAPSPTPNPFQWSGQFRSYYFTRQNASNNPGAQFNFTPGAKYSSTGVNQASWNSAISLHGEYSIPDAGGVFIGGTYLYANPLDGPCSFAASHAKGKPCVSQSPPNTNPDDTLPGFALSTFPEAYLGFRNESWYAKAGDQIFVSPWAGPADTRLKPEAFQGADVAYSGVRDWTFEAADMIQFENRTSNTFQSNTLLTSYPAGNSGLPANIYRPGGNFIETNGFFYGKAGYNNLPAGVSVNGYFYGVSALMNMWWGDAKFTFNQTPVKPYVALQGGYESNAGASYLGKIQSSVFGAQLGANVTKNVLLTLGFDTLPWHSDTIVLPKGVTCSSSTNQITAKGATLAYFLPLVNNGTGQCSNNTNGTTNVYYGGWASPYTDNYTADPFFTTNGSQGMIERRAAGTSERLAVTYTSTNNRIVFLAAYGWLAYGNAAAPNANTNEYDLDGIYRFSKYKGTGPYKGLMLRDRYFVRTIQNTYCGASNTACLAGASVGSQFLGGLPLFKYNRAQLEYDF
jgi:hypothetical protein